MYIYISGWFQISSCIILCQDLIDKPLGEVQWLAHLPLKRGRSVDGLGSRFVSMVAALVAMVMRLAEDDMMIPQFHNDQFLRPYHFVRWQMLKYSGTWLLIGVQNQTSLSTLPTGIVLNQMLQNWNRSFRTLGSDVPHLCFSHSQLRDPGPF